MWTTHFSTGFAELSVPQCPVVRPISRVGRHDTRPGAGANDGETLSLRVVRSSPGWAARGGLMSIPIPEIMARRLPPAVRSAPASGHAYMRRPGVGMVVSTCTDTHLHKFECRQDLVSIQCLRF